MNYPVRRCMQQNIRLADRSTTAPDCHRGASPHATTDTCHHNHSGSGEDSTQHKPGKTNFTGTESPTETLTWPRASEVMAGSCGQGLQGDLMAVMPSATPAAFLHPVAQMCRLARSLPPVSPAPAAGKQAEQLLPWLCELGTSPISQRPLWQCPLTGNPAWYRLLAGNIPATTSSLSQAQQWEVS